MNDVEPDPLLELFRTELREQLIVFSRALPALAAAPNDEALLTALSQAAHTIRGAAHVIHLEPAARLAALLEETWEATRRGQQTLDTDTLANLDRGGQLLALLLDTEPAAWVETRLADVEAVCAALARGPKQEAVTPAPAPVPAPAAPAEFVPQVDASMLELFREEVRVHAATLSAGLLELERAPDSSGQRIEPLMRAAHSLKGAARIVGLDAAVGLAHDLEEAFVAAQAGRLRPTPEIIDVFLRGADLLGSLGEDDLARWAASRQPEVAAVRVAVAAILRGDSPPSGASRSTDVTPVSHSRDGCATKEVVPAAPTAPEPAEAVVRVTAQSLNRLMSLAGESLVQARWLQPFAAALLGLKKQQDRLAVQLGRLAQALVSGQPPAQLVPTLEEAREQAGRCRTELAARIAEFDDHAGAAEDLNSRLYREVIVSRMRPFADGARSFPRLVRDTARHLGKQARLEILGPGTEVDRDILERLEAPLTHLLRNAVDHGLENPDTRVAAGKPEEGLVRIEVRHRAGMLAIAVSDDGAGIDVERLRRKVVERRHATPEMVGRMSEQELLEFLFLPGFSTAATVTEVSGRGVGLDVVQDTVRRVGGSVQIATRPGQGTSFHLLLPITLSVLRAVLVDVAGEPYAFPHNRIDRLLRVPRSEVRSLEHRQFVTVDGRHVGLVLGAQLLDLPAEDIPGDELPVLLMSDAGGTYGLVVEAFRGEQDLVVRPLDPRLGKVPNVSAAALLDDGTPVLIADVEDLIRAMDQFIQSGTLLRCDRAETHGETKKRVLVVDDSITVREVQRQILRTHGYEVEVAVDGQDGWNKVRASRFDLVISDVDMPRMNGLEFVRKMRDDYSLKELPVIVVSYKDREEDRLRGLEAGANHYLTKSSFHDHSFLDAVAALIGRSGLTHADRNRQ